MKVNDTGCLGLVHWDDPEGWNGREEGGGHDNEEASHGSTTRKHNEEAIFMLCDLEQITQPL